jgi:uncharacterized protein (TIGR03066 family)
MKSVQLAVAGIFMLGLAVAAWADDKDDKKSDSIKSKVVGTWEVEDGKGLPKGATLQFTRDGKVLITTKRDGEERKINGTYKIDGSTIKVTTKRDDKERTQDIKVSKVDNKQLVLEGPKGDTLTLKRVGKSSDKDKTPR